MWKRKIDEGILNAVGRGLYEALSPSEITSVIWILPV